MIDATCTWGEGPDVMITFKDHHVVLHEDPKHHKPPQGDYTHGYVTYGTVDLTAKEALSLAASLIVAANAVEEFNEVCKQ